MLLVLACYFLVPAVWLLINSTKDTAQIQGTFGFMIALPLHFSENLVALFTYQDAAFWEWLRNSLIYSTAVALGTVIVSAMGGYAFAVYEFRGKQPAFYIILGAIMIPSTALVLPIFFMASSVGLVNTYWGVILPSIANPFALYLMRVFWETSLPRELIEAARLDGAREFRAFAWIGLPTVMPGLATVALTAFVGTWNNFFLPLVMLTDDRLYPLTLGLSVWNSTAAAQSAREPLYGMILVGSIISMIPLLLVFGLMRRYWISGLTAGATK
ncbi:MULTISPECIES: carbohydrate ABC transporter permease [Microbacterium]|uniref:carbohydrate ABC transporter permease n=1 Tax=Microbacterium TaxID=33882 RepID=UPI001B7D0FAE|nr:MULTISPECIES: carbohydrate ABC transporter permease [Microbacterium]